MSVQEMLQSVIERVGATAKVETIYGKPQQVAGRTLIPVASVGYCFGAAAGQGPTLEGQTSPVGSGGAGGGGVRVQPVGFILADGGEVQFVPIGGRRRLLFAGLAGLAIGLLFSRLMRK